MIASTAVLYLASVAQHGIGAILVGDVVAVGLRKVTQLDSLTVMLNADAARPRARKRYEIVEQMKRNALGIQVDEVKATELIEDVT